MLSPVFPVSACLHISCQMDFINFSQMKYGLSHETALNFSPLIFQCIPLSSLDNCAIIKIRGGQISWIWGFLACAQEYDFVNAPVFSFSQKTNSLKFVFVKDVYSWQRTTLEYHEN